MKQRGMVLVQALVFITIISALLLYQWRAVLLQQQINHNAYQSLRLQQANEKGLLTAYQQLQQARFFCQQPQYSIDEILAKSSSWWQSSFLCHYPWEGMHIAYYITPLQRDQCRQIDGKAAHYWQLTVRTALKSGVATIVQATVVVGDNSMFGAGEREQAACPSVRTLHSVWQSWRQLR